MIKNHRVKETDRIKILGCTFDPKLTWKFHLQDLKMQAKQKLNLIKTLAAKGWGADKQVLLNTYKATVLSKLDYGSILYDSSLASQMLEPIHNLGLKIALGAFHTKPYSKHTC